MHAQNNYARESIIVNDVITFVISIMRSHFTFAIIIVARCSAYSVHTLRKHFLLPGSDRLINAVIFFSSYQRASAREWQCYMTRSQCAG